MGNLTVKESGEMVNIISPNVNNITSFKVHFSPRQEGEGDPSPENIREIVGWNGVEGHKCGKNLFDYAHANILDRHIKNDNGVSVSDGGNSYCQIYIPVMPNTTYTLSGLSNEKRYAKRVYYYDENKQWISRTNSTVNQTFTITTPSNCRYIQIQSERQEYQDWSTVQVELGNTATEFEPYKYGTVLMDWTNTIGNIYGGYIDLITGEIYKNYEQVIFNGTIRWTSITNYDNFNRFIYYKQSLPLPPQNNAICYFNYLTNGSGQIGKGFIGSTGNVLIYTDKNIDSIDSLMEYQTNNPLQLIYELEAPVPVATLSPTQLSTLKGQNNFWSNADYVEIEYELTETFDIQKAKRKIILNQPHVESASGDIVTFDTDMRGKLKECKVYFSPVQEGSGDPSPDNVRNITGWNGITAMRSGKNLVEVSAETRVYQNPTSNTNFTEDNNIIIITGSSNGGYRTSCKPNTQYTYSCEPTLKSGEVYLRVWEEIGEERNMIINQNVNSTKGAVATFTTDSDVYSLIVGFYVYSTAAQTGLTISDFQFELGDTRTTYEPYQSTAYSVDWTDSTGTVYGGYVDLVNGELVAEWEIAQARWGDIKSSTPNSTTGFYQGILNYNNAIITCHAQKDYYINTVCNTINTILWTSGGRTPEHYYGGNSDTMYGKMYIYGNFDDDLVIQIAVRLETPIHYQLTPQQLTTLRGTNTIYSNANGQIDIKYWTHLSKINYMENVQWLDHSYITSAGKLIEESTALSHTTVNSILLPAGNYRIDGFCYQEPPANSLNCRVHEYSAGGSWVKLITSNTASTMSSYILEFSLDHNSYIKLSLPRLLDVKLIKI